MELTNYGITLQRLTEDKIELVRTWRNDPKIQQFMEFRDYITPEMQISWFKRINNEHNYYFIVVWNNKEIGLANIKDIDYIEGSAETGLFLYDDLYWNSDVAVRAVLCMNDFMWDNLSLKKSVIHVMKNNIRAIQFNKYLGYRLEDGQEEKTNQKYVLDVATAKANKKITKIKQMLLVMSGST